MTSLTLVRRVRARPSIVFEAMTTAEGIVHWWGPDREPVLHAESDPRPGGRYRVRFRTRDGQEHESTGEFLEVPIHERRDLRPGAVIPGPAIIVEDETSTVITRLFDACIDAFGYIELTRRTR